jgi:hypothetical protein
MKQVLKFALGCIVIIAFLYFVDLDFFKDETKVYSLTCDTDKYISYQCKGKWSPSAITTYSPDVKNQKVFRWGEGFPMETFAKCSVANKKNWTCKYDSEFAEFGSTNGKYWQVISDLEAQKLFPRTKYVAKWEYRLYSLYQLSRMGW